MAIFTLERQSRSEDDHQLMHSLGVNKIVSAEHEGWVLSIGLTYKDEEKIATYTNGSFSAFMVGTPLYKQCKIQQTLVSLSEDFKRDNISQDDIKGNFILIFLSEAGVSLMTDRTGQQSIFYDKLNDRYSSSFLWLTLASERPFKINRLGMYERLAIGYNIGEDTILTDIVKLTSQNYKSYTQKGISFLPYQPLNLKEIVLHNDGLAKSLDSQILNLRRYFEKINSAFTSFSGDLGLSGGFDCRFLLALGEKFLDKKLHLHSHSTGDVHDKELSFARQLASIYKAELLVKPTKRVEEYGDQDLETILSLNNNLFDGRSARHLGAYSETYTFPYKSETMGNAFYSLNGLGGEIYRDSYFTGNKVMNWKDWSRRYLYLQLAEEIVPVNVQEELDNFIRLKLEKSLDVDFDRMDIFSTHAYYGLIKMPQCNGNLVSAYSKVSPFILPFVEYDNVVEALKAIKYIGVGGQYQASLISKISPKLADVPSNYGGSFLRLPLKYLVWSRLKTWGSTRSRNKIISKKLMEKTSTAGYRKRVVRFSGNSTLESAKSALLKFDRNINFDLALVDSTQTRNIIFLGFLLKDISAKITH